MVSTEMKHTQINQTNLLTGLVITNPDQTIVYSSGFDVGAFQGIDEIRFTACDEFNFCPGQFGKDRKVDIPFVENEQAGSRIEPNLFLGFSGTLLNQMGCPKNKQPI